MEDSWTLGKGEGKGWAKKEKREEPRLRRHKEEKKESAKKTKKQSMRDKKNQEFGVLGAQPRYILRRRMLNCV